MSQEYRPPRLLEASDDVALFTCRSIEQTEWLRRYATQSMSSGSTKVFIVTERASQEVVAYYAWRMAQVDLEDAPERMAKGAGRDPQPVVLLARLGVDRSHERRGLVAGLLADAIVRLLALGEEVGCRGLLIHAESDDAREFYLHLIPELEASPTDSLHLLLMMKDARKTLLG